MANAGYGWKKQLLLGHIYPQRLWYGMSWLLFLEALTDFFLTLIPL
jgi:hypothetical protein